MFPDSKWASDFQFQQYGDKIKGDANANADILALSTKMKDSDLKFAAMKKFGLGADGKPVSGTGTSKATQDDKDRSSIMMDDKFIPFLKNPDAYSWLQAKLKAGYKPSDLKNMVVNNGSPGSTGYIWDTDASFNSDKANKALSNYEANAVYSDSDTTNATSNYNLDIAGIDNASLKAQYADMVQKQSDAKRGYTDEALAAFGIMPEHPVTVAKKKVIAEKKQAEAKKAASSGSDGLMPDGKTLTPAALTAMGLSSTRQISPERANRLAESSNAKQLESIVNNVTYNHSMDSITPAQKNIIYSNITSITNTDSLRAIADSIDPVYSSPKERELKLYIESKLPKSTSVFDRSEAVRRLENAKRFELNTERPYRPRNW
jgi:hypothetical protein